ncbi:hypothetical protein SI65_00801 [Aspergillus cristatus]|uniref:Bromodomain-containing factor 1 n=1 Tax=Aspergillus cristatus TaxID=573508 RepID=A0A1E3BQH4_ASPCR|nr:hypothetical protein SI65_00801 [Aspergillus cristatus]
MATPPAEAPSIHKEEKPQLPPSPNGISSPDVVTGAQAHPVTDSKPDVPNGPTENGVANSATNGANSESSAQPATDTAAPPVAPQATPPAEDAKPSNMEQTATTDETKKEPAEEKPVIEQPASQDSSNNVGADSTAPKETPASRDAPEPAAEPSSEVKVEDNPETPQNQQDSTTVKAELPHHPSVDTKLDSAPSQDVTSNQPQTNDQEMRDAPEPPASPTKISREREPENGDEPAAKRTKIDFEGAAPAPAPAPASNDTGAANLPTPATDVSAAPPANENRTMTKMQHKFLLKGIQSLKRMNDARFYREPVDPIKMNIPHYPQFITRPMDLGTIERKLKANEYPTAQNVIDDFYLMVQNAMTFNGPDHLVAQEGQKLKATFDKQMVNLPRPDQVEEKKSKKGSPKTTAARPQARASQSGPRAAGSPQATTFALGPEGLPLIRRDSTTADGRPKRSIHPPKRDLPYSTKPKKKKFQWELRFCQEVLDELYKTKHYNYAMPFYYPVDPVALNIPTYHSIIKKPMDLGTMSNKLKAGEYENAKDFETDMRQIFKNCFKFNIPGDPTFMAGKTLEEVFNSKWAQKTRYLEAHEPQHEQQSLDSSDEDSDEDVEESDEDTEKLTLLQKQIAEMSRQVEAITQKKKKTPPGSKKVGKSKSVGKKDSKKSGSISIGKKDKKTSKSKPEKQRFVTYHEKQLISNGISSLPDKKMQEALKIIQSNVPALKGTQETEIELDIDELPNDVLLMLLKFVRKNAPHVMEDDDEPAPVISNNSAAPKPKKNKPMSKYEQEAQINMLANNLSRFEGGGGQSPDPVPSVEPNESSDDSDDDSEESEEE